ncbi:MAG TPA: hypothetical protein VG895_04320 [Patescibacteria group bacterium]|nr:hypothetical protein [Patescibacteria group bacterium]
MPPSRRRKQEQKTETKKFNFPISKILIPLFFWLILAFIIYFIDPKTFGIIPFFFFVFFLCVYFSIKNLIITIALTIFVILRYFGLGNFVNFFLLTAIVITILLYESNSKKAN